jgi:hypothetical protein
MNFHIPALGLRPPIRVLGTSREMAASFRDTHDAPKPRIYPQSLFSTGAFELLLVSIYTRILAGSIPLPFIQNISERFLVSNPSA